MENLYLIKKTEKMKQSALALEWFESHLIQDAPKDEAEAAAIKESKKEALREACAAMHEIKAAADKVIAAIANHYPI